MIETRKIARNTIIQSVGKIVSIILGWITVLMMTNYLGASGFGSYTIMTAYLQFFGVAVDLGMVLVTSQLLAEYTNDQARVFSNLLTFRLVTALAVLVFAPIFIWLFPYSLMVKEGVVVLTLSFFFVAILQIFTGLFQKMLTMGRAVVGELLGRFSLLGVLVYAIWTEMGLVFIVGGVVLSSFINLGLAILLSRDIIKLKLAFDKDVWEKIWYRSWPLALGIVFNLVYLKADTLILSFVRSEAEVGVYGAMYRVLEVLVTFPTMFVGLLLPILTTAWSNKHYEDFRHTVAQSFTVIVSVALPMAVGLVIVAPKIVALFGEDFVVLGINVLRLLSIATAIIFVGTFFGHVIVAINEQRSVLWAYALTAVFSLVSYLVIIPMAGAVGAAAVTVAVELLIATLLYFYLRQRINSFFTFTPLVPSFVATLVMAIFLWVFISFSVLLTIPLAMLIYVATLLLIDPTPRLFLAEIFFKSETN